MKRTLAGISAPLVPIVLALLLAGCGGGDESDGSERDDASTTSAGTESTDPSGSADASTGSTGSAEEEDPETETYARGAEVADFCAAMAEIDTAIDEASEGSDADWKRIVAAFDGLGEVGVPDDLPASGITEISEVELLVRQSGSVAELNAAAQDFQPESRTVDAYLEDNCSS